MSDDVMTTQGCADALNRAYGTAAITRQRIHRDIEAGRLQVLRIPATGTRERSMIKIDWLEFIEYCRVYHPTIARNVSRN
jgi:hypothetical protein